MTYALDTSALLRILLNEPKRLASNVAMYIYSRQQKGDAFFISDLVLAEAYYALQFHYDLPKAKALESLKFIADVKGFAVSDHAKDILSLPNLAKASPGFVDRLIHGAAFTSGATTVSCEKDFRRLPSTAVIKDTTPISELMA